MESISDLKNIIDSAPEGATHCCIESGTQYYFKVVGLDAEIHTGDDWLCYSGCALPDLCGVRFISDIKRIIELMEIVEDAAALGFLTPSFDSGVSHKQLCKKYEALK